MNLKGRHSGRREQHYQRFLFEGGGGVLSGATSGKKNSLLPLILGSLGTLEDCACSAIKGVRGCIHQGVHDQLKAVMFSPCRRIFSLTSL